MSNHDLQFIICKLLCPNTSNKHLIIILYTIETHDKPYVSTSLVRSGERNPRVVRHVNVRSGGFEGPVVASVHSGLQHCAVVPPLAGDALARLVTTTVGLCPCVVILVSLAQSLHGWVGERTHLARVTNGVQSALAGAGDVLQGAAFATQRTLGVTSRAAGAGNVLFEPTGGASCA